MRLTRAWSPIGALAIAAALLSGQPAAAAENSASNIETPVTPHFGDVTPFALHYQIANVNSGKCLTVSFGSHDNNANVNQYTCQGPDNRAQLWHAKSFDGGISWEIINFNSGKCLTVSFGSHDNNANVNQYACLGAGNRAQLWEWGEFDVLR